MSKRRAMLMALREIVGRGNGLLPRSAGAKKALQRNINNIPKEALDNPGTWSPKTGYSELGPAMDRVRRRGDYMESRAARPAANPMSAVDQEFDGADGWMNNPERYLEVLRKNFPALADRTDEELLRFARARGIIN